MSGVFSPVHTIAMVVLLIAAWAFLVLILFITIHHRFTNAFCKSNKRLDGKTCVVTGGTMGMGLEIAKDFARRGAKVIIACPFENEGLDAQKLIKEETGNNQVIFKRLNLESLESTRNFAQDILRTEDRLDVLVNNAGVGAFASLTPDGLLNTMQINYYGPFLLTILLLPLLKQTGTSEDKTRIVNTTSVLHKIGTFKPKNMNRLEDWIMVYSNSKLCLVLFTRELAKRLKGQNVVVNAVDPGGVGTKIYYNSTGAFFGKFLEIFCKKVMKTPWEGCQTALHVALDEKLGDVSGEYFRNCKRHRAKALCYDDKAARELWDESVQLVKLQQCEMDECVR